MRLHNLRLLTYFILKGHLYIIDENITPDAVAIFLAAGMQACHINQLKSHTKQRIIDDQLRRLSIRKGYIIVTKDDDFVKSFVDRKVPEKMIFIYGLNSKKSLLSHLKEVIPQFHFLLETHDFIEVNGHELKFPFSG